ncbi:MAG: GNAT family N-acetyltransferase [Oscillospiraceae bacterium]|nr:GNAT family N-acetyltransferase [Oscillospiraceae bacterium]
MDIFDTQAIDGGRITLSRITKADRRGLRELSENDRVYRLLPTFLFERKYDTDTVIEGLYTQGIEEGSLILGIYTDIFCGIAEMYGFNDRMHKISIGYRLCEREWGKGIASEAVRLMTEHIFGNTDIEIITASTMIENRASERVLTKNGFIMTASGVGEDWGYPGPTIANKWFR